MTIIISKAVKRVNNATALLGSNRIILTTFALKNYFIILLNYDKFNQLR